MFQLFVSCRCFVGLLDCLGRNKTIAHASVMVLLREGATTTTTTNHHSQQNNSVIHGKAHHQRKYQDPLRARCRSSAAETNAREGVLRAPTRLAA